MRGREVVWWSVCRLRITHNLDLDVKPCKEEEIEERRRGDFDRMEVVREHRCRETVHSEIITIICRWPRTKLKTFISD